MTSRKKKYYVVSTMYMQQSVSLSDGSSLPLKLSWADGMLGVMPVFSNKKAAKKEAGKLGTIMELVLSPHEQKPAP